MAGHALSATAIGTVVDAFAAAPVANPDGLPGVRLHVDNGPASTMNPLTGGTWGGLSGQDVLPHQAVLGALTPGGAYDWSAVDTIKGASFAARAPPRLPLRGVGSPLRRGRQ